MDVRQHPAAKMMAEVAKSVYNKVDDGIISAILLANALFQTADELLPERGRLHSCVTLIAMRKL